MKMKLGYLLSFDNGSNVNLTENNLSKFIIDSVTLRLSNIYEKYEQLSQLGNIATKQRAPKLQNFITNLKQLPLEKNKDKTHEGEDKYE